MAKFFNLLGASRLALVLVALLIVLTLIAVLVPQEGRFEDHDIAVWKSQHQFVSHLLERSGLFHVFRSWPFLIVLFFLGLNTLTCTVLRLIKTVTGQGAKALATNETIAFVGLHLGIIGLLVGGLFTTGGRMSGHVILTEGQSFKDVHEGYVSLIEGPLRKERHTGLSATLRKVETQYVEDRQTYISAQLELSLDKDIVTKKIEINRPVTLRQLTFTLDEVGYSPRLQIRGEGSPRILSDRFVALKTFKTDKGTLHRDYLPLPFFNNRVYVTLYPSHIRKADEPVITGDQPNSPLIIIEMEDNSGKIVEIVDMPLGSMTTVGGYTFGFGELRRWASFHVSDDPGYPVVCVSLWLGLAALVLRYVPDLRSWFGSEVTAEEKD